MRILYHHRTQAQGAEGNHIRGIVKALRQLGAEVDLLGPPGVEAENQKGDSAEGSGKGLWPLISERAPQVFFEILELCYNIYGAVALQRRLNIRSYDLIYERYALFCAAAAIMSRLWKIPFFIEVNDAVVIERSRPLILKSLASKMERWVLNQASVIYTITEHFKTLLHQAYSIPEQKIQVTPNAVDPELFQIAKSSVSRQELGIQAKNVIAMTGAFVHWHGLRFLAEALSDIVEEKDIHLLFVGDGPGRFDVESVAQKKGFLHRVTFTGFVAPEKVPHYLSLADIFVIPDTNPHGSPIKLFEFMAMGKPIVAASYAPIRSVLEDGRDGLLFSPRNDVEFRKRLLEVLDNPGLAQRLGETAQLKVFRRYTWKANARVILEDFFRVSQRVPNKGASIVHG